MFGIPHDRRTVACISAWLLMILTGSPAFSVPENPGPEQDPGPIQLHDERLEEVRSMMIREPGFETWDDALAELADFENTRLAAEENGEAGEMMKQRELIRLTPDLKPYLFKLLELHFRTLQSESVPMLLNAIALRDDLEEADFAVIARDMRDILESPYERNNYQANGYLAYGVQVLAKHHSFEHETLAIRALKRSKDVKWLVMKVNAAETLGAIGGRMSLPPMVTASEWACGIAENDPSLKQGAERIARALERLESRLGERWASPREEHASRVPSRSDARQVATDVKEAPSAFMGWPIMISVLLGAAVLAGNFWQRLKKLTIEVRSK